VGQVNATSPYKNEELSKAMEAWSRLENARGGDATEITGAGGAGDDDDGAAGPHAQTLAAYEDRVRELNALVGSQRMQLAQLDEQVTDLKADQLKSEQSFLQKVESIINAEMQQQLRRLEFDPTQRGAREPLANAFRTIVSRLKTSDLSGEDSESTSTFATTNGENSSFAPSEDTTALRLEVRAHVIRAMIRYQYQSIDSHVSRPAAPCIWLFFCL